MSQFINHIKLATENIVLCGGTGITKKEQYEYAERMEKMLKNMLKSELLEVLNNPEIMEEKLCEFIDKLS